MKYFSTFSGIGGFELGIQQAYEKTYSKSESDSSPNDSGESSQHSRRSFCVGFSEIDKYAVQIYQRHFPDHRNFADITKINADELPDFDLLCGGFPCQSFSIAGKRKGFEDTRGTLFFDIARIAKAKQPMFLLLENVKGLISHDNGKTLEIILATLQELGYYTNYEVFNSKEYGVPQNRERIFFQCKNIRGLLNVGQSKTITTYDQIIEDWLFQLLLNNLEEVKKLQEHASKDWVVAWLICKEISRNQKSNGKNIWGGIMIPMAGDLFRLKDEEVWRSIVIWLSNELGESLQDLNTSTISTAIKKIIESKTYTYSQMFKATLLATVLLRESSKNLWSEILFNLTLIQGDTNYARINNTTEKGIVGEDGVAHISEELENRERIFIIGHLRGAPRPQVFPFRENSEADIVLPTLTTRYYGGQANGGYIGNIAQLNQPRHSNERVYGEQGISPALNTMQGGNRQPKIMAQGVNEPSRGIELRKDGVAATLRAGGGGAQTPKVAIPVLTPDRPVKRQNGRRFKDDGEESFTITAQDKHGVYDGMKIRRLTPMECERLQGFPDGWTDSISDSQRYKCLGNAVTVNVIKAIVERL